jgi:hypothetical protein
MIEPFDGGRHREEVAIDEAAARIAVNSPPSGSNPCSCHSMTSASASTTIKDRTSGFSSTARAV